MTVKTMKQDFLTVFNSLARDKHRYEVFQDFVTIAAISLHNSLHTIQALEDEYLLIINKYAHEKKEAFPKLLGILICLLQQKPYDALGELYMELELGNANAGQFFTPSHISQLMAQMLYGNEDPLQGKPFVTLSDPAVGAGGMILAFVQVMIDHGHDPARTLWVEGIEIDRTVALMCYIQLTLWNVPARVIVGDTLRMEYRECWYTPAHHTYGWDFRLKQRRNEEAALALLQAETPTTEPEPPSAASPEPQTSGDGFQFDFGF